MMAKRTDSSMNVIKLTLAVSFGLLAAVIGYATWKGGFFELRSRATTEVTPIITWSFASGAEGWTARETAPNPGVIDGAYKFTIANNPTYVRREEVCTGNGKKKPIKCRERNVTHQMDPRMEVSSPSGIILSQHAIKFIAHITVKPVPIILPTPTPPCAMLPPCAYIPGLCDDYQEQYPDTNFCPPASTPVPTATTGPSPTLVPATHFPVVIKYRLKNKNTFEAPISIDVVADGVSHEYAVDFPSTISTKTIAAITVSYYSLRQYKGYSVKVDDMGIIGVRTFTPTPTQIPSGTAVTYTGDLYDSGDGTANPLNFSVVNNGVLSIFKIMEARGNSCPNDATCDDIDLISFTGKRVETTGTVIYVGQMPVFYARTIHEAD